MKIFYHCYGGAHSSVTAAAIHLGWLPTDRLPTKDELNQVPYFDRPRNTDHGRVRFMGLDRYGNEVFIIGRRNVAVVFENMARGLVGVFGQPDEEYRFYNVMPYVNWKMVIGGFVSRKLGITKLGRPIITKGVIFSYWKIVSLVQRVLVLAASDNTCTTDN